MTNTKRDIPITSIENQTVYAVHIVDYLNWASHPDKYKEILALPAIQRGFVWKPKQIQDLWDTLLRGMPVGSLLVQRFDQDKLARSINDEEQAIQSQSSAGWYLLDGQQRTLSMLLGFPGGVESAHKLWVDFSEDGLSNHLKYQFRVTTEHQPFGYQPNGKRLSLNNRRKARAAYDNNDKYLTNQKIFNQAKPWQSDKGKSQHIFLVSELWKLMDDNKDKLGKWQDEIIKTANSTDDGITKRIQNFGNDLLLLKKQWIALIEVKIDNPPEVKITPDNDYLTLLFKRISIGGTRLNTEDLLFSMVKQAWPESHNLVNKLHKTVGVMMTPSAFVMTAYRLAAIQQGMTDRAEPKIEDLHKHLPALLWTDNKPGILRQMIEDESLVITFVQLKFHITYQEKNDIGLPNALLPFIEKPLLQVLLHWCLKTSRHIIKKERKKIIHFILFWIVSRPTGRTASRDVRKASVRLITLLQNENGNFPANSLYKELIKPNEKEEPLFKPLKAPCITTPQPDSNEKFQTLEQRGALFLGTDHIDLYKQFSSRKYLLMWFQRKWIHTTFKNTDFLSGQDEDTVPYDYDHLIPQSNWSSFQGSSNSLSNVTEKHFKEHGPRGALGNSIGNYRIMTDSDNRKRGDTSLADSFLNDENTWGNYAFHQDCKPEFWKAASETNGNHKQWNDQRVLAFQYAVESRTIWLYKSLYKEIKEIKEISQTLNYI